MYIVHLLLDAVYCVMDLNQCIAKYILIKFILDII